MPELQMYCYQTLEWGIGNLLLYNTRHEQPITWKLSSCSHSRTEVEAFEYRGEENGYRKEDHMQIHSPHYHLKNIFRWNCSIIVKKKHNH